MNSKKYLDEMNNAELYAAYVKQVIEEGQHTDIPKELLEYSIEHFEAWKKRNGLYREPPTVFSWMAQSHS